MRKQGSRTCSTPGEQPNAAGDNCEACPTETMDKEKSIDGICINWSMGVCCRNNYPGFLKLHKSVILICTADFLLANLIFAANLIFVNVFPVLLIISIINIFHKFFVN